MPTPHVSTEKMGVGKKSGGKNWTAAEVEARQAAAEQVRRKGKVVMRCPDWLGEEQRKIWKRTLRQVAGLELLDSLDGEMLAIYCDAVYKYRQASTKLIVLNDEGMPEAFDESIKAAQSWARLVAAYADKLGLTPSARARLVKRKADEILDEFEESFG